MNVVAATRIPPLFLSGGGKLGQLIRDKDWEATPLGSPETWPESLRAAVSICLHSSFPTSIYWGPELRLLYNDAWAPIPAERHPWALGRPGAEVWADIWGVVGPQFAHVLNTGEGFSTFDQMLPMDRSGVITETYWNYSLTPILNDDGLIVGVLNQGHETTPLVFARRQAQAEIARLGRMFAQAPGAVALLRGPNHVFEIVNSAYEHLVGRTGLIGRTVREALPEVVSQGFVTLLDDVYRTGQAHVGHAIPVTLRRNNNNNTDAPPEQRFLDFVYQPLTDEAGQRSGIFVQATDVTDVTRAERALQASEAKLTAIVNSIDQMIWSTRPDGFHDYYNDRWYEFTGVENGSTDGDEWNWMFHPEDQERASATWRQSLCSGEPYRIEYRLRHRSGEYRWVIGRAQCVRDDDGQILRWFGTCTDIHDLKLAEERLAAQTKSLQESEELSRSVLDASTDFISVLDLDGAVQLVNPNGLELIQVASNELLKGAHWASFWPPESKAMVSEAIADAVGGRLSRFSAAGPAVATTPQWFDVIVAPVRGANGATLRLVAVARNVTDRKLVEDARQLLLGELNHRVKNLFAVAGGLVALTARSAQSVGEMASELHGRLNALSKAHDLLRVTTANDPLERGGASLDHLVREIMTPHLDPACRSKIQISGPPLPLGMQTTTAFALVLHELGTNAVKYGALSGASSTLNITWAAEDALLRLRWAEEGISLTTKPDAREGFGSKMLRATVTSQLGGAISYDWRDDGVSIQLTAPIERLSR